jgi:two-component system sensor histidine kinase KdpD
LGSVWPYLWSAVAVAAAAGIGLGLISLARLPNVSMVFLLAVLFSAARFGIWPALFSSGLSFLAYNFFFIEPLHTFSVTEPHELLALFVLLVTAVLTSTIAGHAREQARRAAEREAASQRLYRFARRLSALADPQSVLDHAVIQAHGDLYRPCVILIPTEGHLTVSAAMSSCRSSGGSSIWRSRRRSIQLRRVDRPTPRSSAIARRLRPLVRASRTASS